jgi:hypothetical protein
MSYGYEGTPTLKPMAVETWPTTKCQNLVTELNHQYVRHSHC